MPSQIVVQRASTYADASQQGNVFMASLQAAATFGTALTATAVTLTLYNPAGSGKNLVLLEGTASIVTMTTAGSVVYAVNDNAAAAAPSATTPLANFPKATLVGGGTASVAKVYTAATLPAAPLAYRIMFGGCGTGVTSTGPTVIVDDIGGRLVLAPNTAVTLQGITIVGTGILSLTWQEVPA